MSRFLDNPPSEEMLPLFPTHWSYSVFKWALVIEVLLFFVAAGASGIAAMAATFVAATIPYFFASVPWLTRIRYAFTGGLFWALMLIPLTIFYFCVLRS